MIKGARLTAHPLTIDDPAHLAESGDKVCVEALRLIRTVITDAGWKLDGPERERLEKAFAKVKGLQAIVAVLGMHATPALAEDDPFRDMDYDDAFAESLLIETGDDVGAPFVGRLAV